MQEVQSPLLLRPAPFSPKTCKTRPPPPNAIEYSCRYCADRLYGHTVPVRCRPDVLPLWDMGPLPHTQTHTNLVRGL